MVKKTEMEKEIKITEKIEGEIHSYVMEVKNIPPMELLGILRYYEKNTWLRMNEKKQNNINDKD